MRAVFIRAPWIAEHGDGVEVLASVDGHPVAARQGRCTVISFHPELSGDTRVHERFLAERRGAARALVGPAIGRRTGERGRIRASICGSLCPMAVIERLDFLGVPTQDPERSRAFYRGVLGLRPRRTRRKWEQWAGDTCFAIWEPERQGMPSCPAGQPVAAALR